MEFIAMVYTWLRGLFPDGAYNRFNLPLGEIPYTALKQGDWLLYRCFSHVMVVCVVHADDGVLLYSSPDWLNDSFHDDMHYYRCHGEHIISAVYMGTTKPNKYSKFSRLVPQFINIKKPVACHRIIFSDKLVEAYNTMLTDE